MRLRIPVVLSFALMSSAFGQLTPGGPTHVPDPAYPIQVRILQRNMSREGYNLRMWGRADLFGPQEQGFDYQSTCSEVLMITKGQERYSARWKKQDKELEILVSKIGSDKPYKCSLKVDMQQYTYEYEHGATGQIITRPLVQ